MVVRPVAMAMYPDRSSMASSDGAYNSEGAVMALQAFQDWSQAGLIDLVQKGFFDDADSIVFVHTGGVAGLFGYSDQLKP